MTGVRLLVALALVAGAARPAAAKVSSDEPTAVLIFPLIRVDAIAGIDSVIQLTNSADGNLAIRCAYENKTGTPTLTPFSLQLTSDQPVAWRASVGLATVPGGGSGTIPVIAGPFTGLLRCATTNAGGMPSNLNALVGAATIERFDTTTAPAADSAHYNATGFEALAAAANGNDQLVLGGPGAEYAACPEALALQVFFDGAMLPLGAAGAVEHQLSTTLAVVTCAHGAASDASSMVSLRIINDMGQITSANREIHEQLVTPLSRIDSDDPSRSIFSAAVQGTLSGLVTISPMEGDGGVLALAIEEHANPDNAAQVHSAAVRPQLLGDRTAPDTIDLAVGTPATPTATVPMATPTASAGPACVGDCDGDGEVEINELISGVNIALGNQALTVCPAFDGNGSGDVSIGELITAVSNSLNGCE
jgi:hypothetical protein